ncbi:methyltransferase domain-containing protein [Streptomyces sp. TRM66268-LWL]|uniref:Methyltransferase domain-containing protein n=1 Tax=Streptomyces polyasparticus TaxID=2767826 RepID=A0ABR7SKU4_9ACTN|nr:class I SAM-dependent methyltransferase [Streptomyces polyasparticus]MBC9716062.1 methyltransferase domain-containing protein [Streptomyces polyasparticus]
MPNDIKPATDNTTEWDAERYDRQFGYVSSLAGGVVELLAPEKDETVLDLGCGTGELAESIRESGARIVAVDSDPAMVEKAAKRLGQEVILADGHAFTVDEPVDAVFSNAALHWMLRPEEVVRSVRAALRTGGRFVAELGGAGNVATIIAGVRTALAEHGLDEGMEMPWYFPSPAEYAGLLEANGFRVARMEYFPRPTELTECPGGVADWVAMFGSTLIAHVPADVLPAVLARVNELVAPTLERDGSWYADYYRLRFVAEARDAAETTAAQAVLAVSKGAR